LLRRLCALLRLALLRVLHGLCFAWLCRIGAQWLCRALGFALLRSGLALLCPGFGLEKKEGNMPISAVDYGKGSTLSEC